MIKEIDFRIWCVKYTLSHWQYFYRNHVLLKELKHDLIGRGWPSL